MVKNRWILVVSVALLVVFVCSAALIKNVSADNEPTEHPTEGMGIVSQEAVPYGTGMCGENLTWTLDANGLLTIEGSGTVDFKDEPLGEVAAYVRKVLIKAGVSGIKDGAFDGCTELVEVTFEGDAPAFDANVFAGVTATVFYPGDNDTWTSEVMQNYGGSITWTEND